MQSFWLETTNLPRFNKLFGEKRCDVLIIETGHFGIDDVYEYLKDKNVKKIFFTHNGREILNYPAESQEKMEQYFKGRAVICEDGLTVKI